METKNIIVTKSKKFAMRIIKTYSYLKDVKKEYVLSKQLLRSGTSIGANIKEAIRGQSRRDFIAKMYISLKEASETEYWLELLIENNFLREEDKTLYDDCQELLRILTAILKSAQKR